jgi:hypothetical protein
MAESLTVRQAESVRLMIDSTKIVNRFTACLDGEIELTATQVQAGKALLDKSLPSLQAADITAHSSPQMEGEDALKAKLLALIQSDPLLIRELVKHLGPHALVTDGTSTRTLSELDPPQPVVVESDVHTQQHDGITRITEAGHANPLTHKA